MYNRFARIAEDALIPGICLPDPRSFNTVICSSKDLTQGIQGNCNEVVLYCGVMADGVVINPGQAAAIASGDCPTIVAYASGARVAIVAHAGLGSLIDEGLWAGKAPTRTHFSVVDAIVDAAKRHGVVKPDFLEVRVVCGIGPGRYERKDLAGKIRAVWPTCVDGQNVNMAKLITLQFERHGVLSVASDQVDTYGDQGVDGKPLWHSNRRDRNGSGRNLVLVVNPR